jgi:Lipase maturation factor
MTGVKGRPEVVIEGSNSMEGPWQEYEFKYKPGNVKRLMPMVGKSKLSPH